MVRVSVIIAVYNVEKYLEKCIDSLLGQTLEEIEIIAVNDGSTDGSQQILDEYMKKTDKLRCFKTENGGASAARNYALQFATGEYIGYVDSDDFVDSNMYQGLYEKAKKKDSDIVECNLRHTYLKGEDIELMERFYTKGELLCFGRYVVWNKIYRRQWLLENNATFPQGLIYEDVEFIANLVPYINIYDYVDIAPIHYVQRQSSVNNSTSLKTLDILQILKNITEFYQTNGFYQQYEKELEYLYIRILLCSSLARICHMTNKELRKTALRQNWELLAQQYPNWKSNPILKRQRSHQAMFMRAINKTTYNWCGFFLPIAYNLRSGTSKKWK